MTSKKNEKYHLILQGALKVFAENGYHRSQVSKIAKAAGVADGTIYLYFKRKEDILIRLFQEKLGELVGKFHESVKGTTDAVEALRTVCSIHFSELESNPELAYVTQIELRQSDLELRKEIGNALKPYIVLIENILEQGIQEKKFRPDLNVKLVRSLIFGAMDEAVTSWLISGRKYSLSDQVEETLGFFLNGVSSGQ
ncbi:MULTISPECIES: TetR/AcrR family transcriptional regulator [Paenibacillus]|jgi:TetR/AcrR family fatty acid metabolism transcriptional regulator|uniref:Transcriptional regulator, TetR family n=2 Tax=Paenibacillus lactis TaxID=228574 RepID=G4HP58_9BACL|nr:MULTISPECIES: TetR/AcrR family transcriptional regulator [Paenibacillus]EHB48895.1 transcriptional regulator, TetR family [Paenibacillus lactis 154]MBP1892025.1 TetR/AcrR family fatty acid metabolism transcriptional regulator [Paenibacillus lactis]MCM3494472.1 TetR family transcriptional regulator [Paenibacillus lactis]GIO89268.1 fatty acid metabolism regulator protein [Paenibacillus lactis]HAF97378.1 TetR family transcriptional regulator [Paenibacillus lactis]